MIIQSSTIASIHEIHYGRFTFLDRVRFDRGSHLLGETFVQLHLLRDAELPQDVISIKDVGENNTNQM